jgi:hypothetical protein
MVIICNKKKKSPQKKQLDGNKFRVYVAKCVGTGSVVHYELC